MRDDVTAILAIVDRSGSMIDIKQGIIDGFNQFIEEQRAVPGTAYFSMALFDTFDEPRPYNARSLGHVRHGQFCYESVYDFINMKEVKPLTAQSYQPRGATPLYDALKKGIDEMGARLKAIPEPERPGKVVLVIITDGCENASQYASQEEVNAMIKHQQDKYAWQVVYLGANQDSFAESNKVGIQQYATMNYSYDNVGATRGITVASASLASYRKGVTDKVDFSNLPQEELAEKDDPIKLINKYHKKQ